MADDVTTSSGSNLSHVELSSTSTLTTTSVTTVTQRPEDVQAIVSGLAANPNTLVTMALMMQLDGQQNPPTRITRASLHHMC